MNDYLDIINLEHHVPRTRKRMSIEDRAAQFAPFAALTGYDERVVETARIIDKKIEIDDSLKLIISDKLNIINLHIKDKPLVKVVHFVKDNKKDGGKYLDYIANIRRIDSVNRNLIFTTKKVINIDDIIDITLE